MWTEDKRLVVDNFRKREGIPYNYVSNLISFKGFRQN